MILNNASLTINGILAMVGGANHYIQITPKTTPERNAHIATLGLADGGKIWFNSDTLQLELWTGTDVRLLG